MFLFPLEKSSGKNSRNISLARSPSIISSNALKISQYLSLPVYRVRIKNFRSKLRARAHDPPLVPSIRDKLDNVAL